MTEEQKQTMQLAALIAKRSILDVLPEAKIILLVADAKVIHTVTNVSDEETSEIAFGAYQAAWRAAAKRKVVQS